MLAFNIATPLLYYTFKQQKMQYENQKILDFRRTGQ